ncbi:MAG TPA: hypothetical protein VL069_16850, partial [Opitutus sp.]|nr:hypothetical protein [Opitutus sp.]
ARNSPASFAEFCGAELNSFNEAGGLIVPGFELGETPSRIGHSVTLQPGDLLERWRAPDSGMSADDVALR